VLVSASTERTERSAATCQKASAGHAASKRATVQHRCDGSISIVARERAHSTRVTCMHADAFLHNSRP
jgi:hypothetical protein